MAALRKWLCLPFIKAGYRPRVGPTKPMDVIRRDTEYFNVVAQLHGGASDLCTVWTEEILGREPSNAGALLLRALALGDTNRTLALALTRQACRHAPGGLRNLV